MLVRIAQALKEEDLSHRVRIVFFDAEEIGLIGSKNYIETHKGDNIAAAINLDVLGYGNTIMFGPRNLAGNNVIYRALKSICVEKDFNFI